MSKKPFDDSSEGTTVPFFIHLLTAQKDPAAAARAAEGTPANAAQPTYRCGQDIDCPTLKYPSDGDEPTSPTYDK